MYRRYLFLIFLLILLLPFTIIFAQYEEEVVEEEIVEDVQIELTTINLEQLFQLLSEQKGEIVVSDYIIQPEISDRDFLINKIFFDVYLLDLSEVSTKRIYFYNCTFSSESETPLIIDNPGNLEKLNIVGCSFNSPFTISNISQNSNYPVIIENCIFRNDFSIENAAGSGINKLNIRKNSFAALVTIKSSVDNLFITNNSFNADSSIFKTRDEEEIYYQLCLSDNSSLGSIRLSNNRFLNNGLENIFSIDLSSTEADELQLDFNNLQTLDLTGASIEKSLLIDSLNVEKYIGILNFDFPESNTNISWYNLGGEKLAIFNYDEFNQLDIYQAKTDKQLSNNLMYNDLMSAYAKFNTLYHDRGDISSANSSYVEIKDIETRRQAYIQTVKPTFNNYINYNLNRFLRFFSDYATNPGKSLIMSIWIILIFSAVYVFTFSRWDGMNLKYLALQIDHFSDYIIHDKPIKECFQRKTNLVERDLEDLINKYIEANKKIPRMLHLFTNPLLFLGRIRFSILPNLIRYFNFQPKAWSNLNLWQKTESVIIIIGISVIFILYILFVKIINSLILSLNSFIVIGFGAMPEEEEGIAMYLSIIEGIIGWFLMTIFTITLFSQVLQSS